MQTVIKTIRVRLGLCGRKVMVQGRENYGAAVILAQAFRHIKMMSYCSW